MIYSIKVILFSDIFLGIWGDACYEDWDRDMSYAEGQS